MNKAKKVLGGLWLALAMAMPGSGADTPAALPTADAAIAKQREKARSELKAWLDGQGRWDNKKEHRPGEWIDKLPSTPPPIKRIEPGLDKATLYNDASILERHWPEFLSRHPMTAKQLEKSGILALPKYDAMPGQDFPAFKKKLAQKFVCAFDDNLLDRRRQNVLGTLVWTVVYADLLAARGDEMVRGDASELMQMLARLLPRFYNPALAKDMPIAPCLAVEVVWPGLAICPADNAPQKKADQAYAIDRAFQIGYGLQVPAATKYNWKQVQLALCKWRLGLRISRCDGESAANDLAQAYVMAKDYGRAIQYYHLAMQVNPESVRNYVSIIKDLLMEKYPKPQAEQQYLVYLKLLSRGELASKGGSMAIQRRRAEECQEKGDFEQAIRFLNAMNSCERDPRIDKEISELQKKIQNKNKLPNQKKNTPVAGKGASA